MQDIDGITDTDNQNIGNLPPDGFVAGDYQVGYFKGSAPYTLVGEVATFSVYYEYNAPSDDDWEWSDNYTSATATFTANGLSTETKTLTDNNPTSEVTKAPKCEEKGTTVHRATVTVEDDFILKNPDVTTFTTATEEETPALGHAWPEEWTVVTPATETTEGLEKQVCTREGCDAERTQPIPRLDHVHVLTLIPAEKATCTEAGNNAYYKCEGCGKFFSDEAAEHEIEENSWVIPAKQHDWGDWTYSATDKKHTRVCKNDESHQQTEACSFEFRIEGDEVINTCTVCGGSYTTSLLSTDKTQYGIYSAAEPIIVTAYGTGRDWVGLYQKGDTPGEDGAVSFYYYYPADQGNQPFDLLQGTKQHDLTPGEYTLYLLENDGYNVLASVDIALIHSSSIATDKSTYTVGEPVLVTASSDVDTAWVGLYEYNNSDPLDTTLLSKYDVKDANGQEIDILNDEIVSDKLTNPIGHYKVILFYDGYDIDYDGHMMIRSFYINEVYEGPTWEWNNNLDQATATFTGQHDENDTKTINAIITSEVTKEATEAEDGLKTYTATVNSVDFATVGTAPFTDTQTEVIPKLTHVHTCEAVPAVDPKCEVPGNTEYYKCTGCGAFFEDAAGTKEIKDKDSVVIPAIGHKWGDWTSNENKTHTRVCENDRSHTETQECDFEEKPNSDPDKKLYVCKECDYQYEEFIVPVITTDKEEYKVGEDILITTELNGCDGSTSGGWIALYKKGEADNKTVNTRSLLWYFPACFDNPKLLQSVFTPSDTNKENMGEWIADWGDNLPEGEYSLVFLTGGSNPPYTRVGQPTYFSVKKGIKSEEVTLEPTCTEPGNKHIIYDDDTEEDVEIEALGHDPKEEWIYDSEQSMHYHECSRCGEHTDLALCTFDEGKVIKEPTATEEGEMLFTCEVCGGTYTDSIPTLATQGVKRVYGSTRYQTAMLQANELKEYLSIDKFDNIIVATGTNYADALSGAYLGYVKMAPILLVRKDVVEDVKAYIKANLAAGGTVYLLGGEAVVPGAVTEGLDGVTTKRLAGATRYETNIEILKEAGVDKEPVLVCDGTNFADSLSASAVGLPILLVKKGLNKTQRAYLDGIHSDDYYLVGGEGVLPPALKDELENKYGSVMRLGGKDRYETSVKVAKEFFGVPEKAVVAYAMNYPDGLCGGTLAAYMGAPLLLVRDDKVATTVDYTRGFEVKSGIVLGGSALVSDKSVRSIYNMADSDEIYVIK